MALSLRLAASAFGTIGLGFGINAILRPDHALSFFELDYPTSPNEQALVNNLMYVYGARDIFMGIVTYIAAYYGNNKALGWTLLSVSGVAYADGLICWINGHGEWNHWGYAPVITFVSFLLLRIQTGNKH
ncbi:putative integral membrane protein [Aspergillus unguis]